MSDNTFHSFLFAMGMVFGWILTANYFHHKYRIPQRDTWQERSYQLNPGGVAVMQVTFGTNGIIHVDSAEVSHTQRNIDPFISRNLERYVAWYNVENKGGVHPKPYGK